MIGEKIKMGNLDNKVQEGKLTRVMITVDSGDVISLDVRAYLNDREVTWYVLWKPIFNELMDYLKKLILIKQ